ncbi:PREDICTED: uncharacterized protein C1orf131 homolog [Tinamus guttatus]|nr:PREDICTED: uncharacterized protein C1orf131 homolog [Tinamus guttatus]
MSPASETPPANPHAVASSSAAADRAVRIPACRDPLPGAQAGFQQDPLPSPGLGAARGRCQQRSPESRRCPGRGASGEPNRVAHGAAFPAPHPRSAFVALRGVSSSRVHGPDTTQKVSKEKNVNKDKHEFNFEKARLEVHRFGITGYEKQEQRVLERERAIMLGAKPPKREHVNYKIYQEKMREKRTMKDDSNGKEHKGGPLKKRKKEKKERMAKKKKSVPSIWPAGQVGKFRDGTLILHSSDIKKIKSSKVIK